MTFDYPKLRARAPGWVWCLVLGYAIAHTTGCRNVIGIEQHRFIATDSGTTDASSSAACERYCDDALKNCAKESLQPYQDRMDCLAVCAYLPAGKAANATMGNSVSCRAHYASDASGAERDKQSCSAAAPGGGSPHATPACGSNCEAYCDLYQQVCPETADAMCPARCPALPDRQAYSASSDYNDGDDTIQCRLAHLTAATRARYTSDNTTDPALRMSEDATRQVHCGHAKLLPTLAADNKPCDLKAATAPNCPDYCTLVMTACTASNKVYDDPEQCLATCKNGFPEPAGLPDNMPDLTMNTLSCRRWHAYYALTDSAQTHCPHAGPGGDNDCGMLCPTYCSLLKNACERRYDDVYGSDDARCASDCQGLVATGGYSVEGEGVRTDTYQCRLHNIAKVFGNGGNGAVGCDKVFPADTCP